MVFVFAFVNVIFISTRSQLSDRLGAVCNNNSNKGGKNTHVCYIAQRMNETTTINARRPEGLTVRWPPKSI